MASKKFIRGRVDELGSGAKSEAGVLRSYIEVDGKRYKKLFIPNELESTVAVGKEIDFVISRGMFSPNGIFITKDENGRVISAMPKSHIFANIIFILAGCWLLIAFGAIYVSYQIGADFNPPRDIAIGLALAGGFLLFDHSSLFGLHKALGLSTTEIRKTVSKEQRKGNKIILFGFALALIDISLFFFSGMPDGGVGYEKMLSPSEGVYVIIPQAWILPPIAIVFLIGFYYRKIGGEG